MKITELTDKKTSQQKAGVIPFVVNSNGSVLMMFMTPSDPEYGGTAPQIAKGCVDQGESIQEAAVREGEEELGLRKNNIIETYALPVVTITGLNESYSMAIFAVYVKSKDAFDQPHYETGSTAWLTPEQFARRGRHIQRGIVAKAAALAAQKTRQPT